MLKKISFRSWAVAAAFLYISMLITSCQCGQERSKPETAEINLSVKRFEKDLFSADTSRGFAGLDEIRNSYGTFFDLFAYQITRLGARDDHETHQRFLGFVNDSNFIKLEKDIQAEYGDFSKWEKELSQAFSFYHYYFPEKAIPAIVTYMSIFSYPVVADSALLGIGLDMYMGPDYFYYNTLEPPLPQFIRRRMSGEYLVSDAMKGWAASDFNIDESRAKLIEVIINEGRLISYLEKVLPEAHDSIITGYTSAQLEWLKANESRIWAFFLDNKLLFTDDPNLLMKYADDGPTTNGFPKESPGNLGRYLGWQIVRAYIKSHPEVTLAELMENKNLLEIFQASGYKPEK